MIDWTLPVRRIGHHEALMHTPRWGTDRWVGIGDGQVIYTANGSHVRLTSEALQPNLENVPRLDLSKRLVWADTGDRVWFSHWEGADHKAGIFIGTTRDGIAYTYNAYGQCIDEDNDDRWLIERDDALAVICREMSESPMDQAAASLPMWGMFGGAEATRIHQDAHL